MDDNEWKEAIHRYVGDHDANQQDIRRAVALVTAALADSEDTDLVMAAISGLTTESDRPPLVAILGLLASLVALNVRAVHTLATVAGQKPQDLWQMMMLELESEGGR
jgi:hypothetical protein